MRPPLVFVYAFAYKPRLSRLSLLFRSCVLLCRLGAAAFYYVARAVYFFVLWIYLCAYSVDKLFRRSAWLIKRKHAAACVCACHVIGYLACFCPSVFRVNGCIAGREIAPPPLRPNFPLPCRFPLPVFNLPRVSNYPFCPLLVLLLVLRAECVFLLGRAAEFNVPLMRASGAAKRSRPLFVQRAPIEPSAAIAQGSGAVCVVGRRFQTRSDESFRDGLRRMRVL